MKNYFSLTNNVVNFCSSPMGRFILDCMCYVSVLVRFISPMLQHRILFTCFVQATIHSCVSEFSHFLIRFPTIPLTFGYAKYFMSFFSCIRNFDRFKNWLSWSFAALFTVRLFVLCLCTRRDGFVYIVPIHMNVLCTHRHSRPNHHQWHSCCLLLLFSFAAFYLVMF